MQHNAPNPESPPASRSAASMAREMLDNPWLILGMLFFVTAALGLPLLWFSRAFSAPVKIVLSITVIAYTVLILWLFTLVMMWCWGRIEPFV